MNVKKILAIAIIALAVISCLSIASAELSDSKDKTAEKSDSKKEINLNKTDASYNIEKEELLTPENWLQVGSNSKPNGPTKSEINADVSFTITSDISSLNDSDKKVLEELTNKTDSVTVDFENRSRPLVFYNTKFSIDGNTFTATASNHKINITSNEVPDSGSVISSLKINHKGTIIKIS